MTAATVAPAVRQDTRFGRYLRAHRVDVEALAQIAALDDRHVAGLVRLLSQFATGVAVPQSALEACVIACAASQLPYRHVAPSDLFDSVPAIPPDTSSAQFIAEMATMQRILYSRTVNLALAGRIAVREVNA